MENLEQPIETTGSKNEFGKFKDAESLLKAYNNLEAEFTKKSQKLATLESETEKIQEQTNKQVEIERKIDEFVTKFEAVKPFKSALKESLTNQEDANLEEEAIRMISKNYKSAVDFVKDGEFLNNYIYNNQTIKEKIIKDYLSNLTQNSPIKLSNSASSISLCPPNTPTTIQEAGKLAKNIIKNK